ncbi:hypothetical protein F5B21DRAFT_503469 [Xylaria acuta]|nr:hypothetical protein F5B21DRAFT_503469 [Xylaria acuta]
MATGKKPTADTMTSRLRWHSSSLLNRIFHFQNGGRDTKPVSTEQQPAGLPRRVINEKKAFPRVSVSEKSTPPSQSAESTTDSRPMGALEWFFKRLGDKATAANREHAAFFTVLQVRFPSQVTNIEDYIARAWEVVGRRFPALRAEISPPDQTDPHNRPRFTVRPFDIHSFRNSFSTHPGCPNVDVLFGDSSPIRSTATCYWLPSPGQIVLRTAHWRADGFGQILLTDVFMSTLASIVQNGLDAPLDDSLTRQPTDAPITPGLEDLIRKYVKDDTPADPADADILMDTLVNGGQSIAVPTIPGSEGAVATKCSRAGVRMDAESSASLTRACRAQGVSVTSALNAAIIRATARYPQAPGADAYVIFAPVDLRAPLIAAGARECTQPTGTYVSGLPLRIEGVVRHLDGDDGGGESVSVPGKSFDTLAEELSAFYSQDLLRYRRPGGDDAGGGGGKTVSLLQLADPYLEKMTDFFATFPAPGCPYPKTPVISSLGKMDGLVKREYAGGDDDDASSSSPSKLYVTDFWVGIENATPMITFHPWSWADELTLSAAWNESFYSREIVFDALEKIMEELGEGLKMDKVSYRIVTSCRDTSVEA